MLLRPGPRSVRRTAAIGAVTTLAVVGIGAPPPAAALPPPPCLEPITTVDLGTDDAYGMTIDPVNGDVYVAMDGGGRVDVLSGTTNALIDSITVPSASVGFLAIDHTHDRLYVSSFSADAVYVMDISEESLVATLPVDAAQELALDVAGHRLFAAGQSTTVQVFNTLTNTSLGTLPVGGSSLGVAFDPVSDRVFVGDYTNNTLDVFNATTRVLVDSWPLGGSMPVTVRHDPTDGNVWVTLRTSGKVVEVDPRPAGGVTGVFATLASAQALAINPSLGQGYAAPSSGTGLTVFSLLDGTVLSTFPTGAGVLVADARVAPVRIYVSGYDDGTVTVIGSGALPPFSDVTGESPFCFDIGWMVQRGITTGFADGTFRPTSPVTRQSIAAFMYRLMGEPVFPDPVTATFDDVPPSSQFFTEIEWLADEGIAGGFADGGFHPTASVSRQALAAFLYELAGAPAFTPPVTPTFDDVPPSSLFYDEVEWLASTGIAGGFADGGFHPTSPVSRQAASAFLHRFDTIIP